MAIGYIQVNSSIQSIKKAVTNISKWSSTVNFKRLQDKSSAIKWPRPCEEANTDILYTEIHSSLCCDWCKRTNQWWAQIFKHANQNLTLIAWINMPKCTTGDNQLRQLWGALTSLHRVRWKWNNIDKSTEKVPAILQCFLLRDRHYQRYQLKISMKIWFKTQFVQEVQ